MTNRAPSAVLVLALCAVALSGCSPAPWPQPSSTPTSAPSASPSAPSPEPSPSEVVPDFSATCDEVLSPDAVYEFNPNLGLDTDVTPASGSTAATIASLGGVDCAWRNLSSGGILTAAIAEPGSTALSELEADIAASSQSTSAYGSTGFFSERNGIGEAVVFVDGAVILIASEEFAEAGDATGLMAAAVEAARG